MRLNHTRKEIVLKHDFCGDARELCFKNAQYNRHNSSLFFVFDALKLSEFKVIEALT